MTFPGGQRNCVADWENAARWRKAAGEHLLAARRALAEAHGRCPASIERIEIERALAVTVSASERCERGERACRERAEALR